MPIGYFVWVLVLTALLGITFFALSIGNPRIAMTSLFLFAFGFYLFNKRYPTGQRNKW